MTPTTLAVGTRREARRVLHQRDLDRFAAVSGDDNPIHVDPVFAATTPFAVPVAHGMHLYSLVRAELRRLLPEAVTRSQELVFPAPTPVGAEVTVWLEVTAIVDDEVTVTTEVTHADGTGLTGVAVLSPAGHGAPPPVDVAATPAASSDGPPGGAVAGWWETAVGRSAAAGGPVLAAEVDGLAALVDDAGPDGEVPEPLIAGRFSRLLGVELPGPGTNYLKQTMVFHRAARVGEDLTATVTVTRVRPDKRLVDLDTRCTGEDGALVASGRALVLARGVEPPRPT